MLNLDSENSLPEWWSTFQLLLAAGLVLLNGFAESNRRWKAHWFALAVIFVYLSMDESAGVHEYVMGLLVPYQLTDFLLMSWIIPYAIASLVVGLIYLPFVAALPPPTRWRVVFAGALLLTSAMGDEAIAGHCASVQNWTCYRLEVIAEESGEIIGITIFILALLALLGSRRHAVAVKLGNGGFGPTAFTRPPPGAIPSPQARTRSPRSWVGIYAAMALLTFVFQTSVRLPQCSGFENCALSIAKGAGIWPASWLVYVAGLPPINRLY